MILQGEYFQVDGGANAVTMSCGICGVGREERTLEDSEKILVGSSALGRIS